jgi:hypothetical protein
MADRSAVETQTPMTAVAGDRRDEPALDALPPAVKAALEDQTDLARERRYHCAAHSIDPWAVSRRPGLLTRLLRRLSRPGHRERRSPSDGARSSSFYGDRLPHA